MELTAIIRIVYNIVGDVSCLTAPDLSHRKGELDLDYLTDRDFEIVTEALAWH